MLFSIGHTADMIARYRLKRELRIRKNPYKNVRKHYAAMVNLHAYALNESKDSNKILKEKVRKSIRKEKIRQIVLNCIQLKLILTVLFFIGKFIFS